MKYNGKYIELQRFPPVTKQAEGLLFQMQF